MAKYDIPAGVDPFADEPPASKSYDIPAGVDPFEQDARRNARKDYSGSEEPGLARQFIGGAKHAWDRAARGLESLVPGGERLSRALLQPDLKQLVAQGDAFVSETGPASSLGRFAGDVSMVAPVAAAAGPTALAQGLVGAGTGLVFAPDDKLFNAALGGIAGAGTQGVINALRSGVGKFTPEAQRLMERNVPLTWGQAAGPGTWRNSAEQALTSSPIGGQSIANRRNEAVQAGLLEAVNLAGDVMPGATRIDLRKAVREGAPSVDEASKDLRSAISDRYETLLQGIERPRFDTRGELKDAAKIAIADVPMLAPKDAKAITRYASDRLGKGFENMSGPDLKAIDAELGHHVRTLASSPNPRDRIAAEGWSALQRQFRDHLEQLAPELPAANRAWRQQSAIDRAILPGHETTTPLRLNAQLDKARLTNTPLGQHAADLLRSGVKTVPDSGTAGRSALLALVGGAAGGVPGVLASAAIPAVLGSRMVQRGLTGQTAAQKAIQRADPNRKISPGILSVILAALRGQQQE